MYFQGIICGLIFTMFQFLDFWKISDLFAGTFFGLLLIPQIQIAQVLTGCPSNQDKRCVSVCICACLFVFVSISLYMDVSENNGTPKSSILIGFSIINHPFHPFWGYPYFRKHPYLCKF